MVLRFVRVLGWLVIAHGLSHAVLPLRGSIAPSMLIDDYGPVALYAVGMVGFVAAGLGLLGVRPLDRVISPLLVLASGLSLVAIVRFQDPTLWFGAACDVALLLVGLWRAYGGWPAHPGHGRVWHAVGMAGAFALLASVGLISLLYPWHRTWGSTRDELVLALPGDPASRNPALEVQRAVTIDAPLADVWTALAETIAERGARVQQLDERQHAMHVESLGTIALRPVHAAQTRVIVRSTVGDRALPVWASAFTLASELPQFVRDRRMMLSLKKAVEQRAWTRAAVSAQ